MAKVSAAGDKAQDIAGGRSVARGKGDHAGFSPFSASRCTTNAFGRIAPHGFRQVCYRRCHLQWQASFRQGRGHPATQALILSGGAGCTVHPRRTRPKCPIRRGPDRTLRRTWPGNTDGQAWKTAWCCAPGSSSWWVQCTIL